MLQAGEGVSRVKLLQLCYGRSGDKGNTANVGLIARNRDHLPYLRAWLTEERVAEWFAHALIDGAAVRRYELPGIGGLNFMLDGALAGGGTASLRTDSLAKAFAQQLLAMPIDVPSEWLTDDVAP